MPGTAVIDNITGQPTSPPPIGSQTVVSVVAHEDIPAGAQIPITVTFPDGSTAQGFVNWPSTQRVTSGYHVTATIPAGLPVTAAPGAQPNQIIFTQTA